MLIIPFICPFFFFSNKMFCHRYLSSCESQLYQILYIPTENWSLLCKRKPRCWHLFCLFLFSFFHFSISHFNVIHSEICVKHFSGTTAPRILKIGTNIFSIKVFVTDFSDPLRASLQILYTSSKGWNISCTKCWNLFRLLSAIFFSCVCLSLQWNT